MKENKAPTEPETGIMAHLNPEDRETLLGFGETLKLKKDEVVIKQGDRQGYLYLVKGGVLHARREAGGSTILLGRIVEDEWFGEINLFEPGLATATVSAMQSAEVWRISRVEMESFISKHPDAGRVLLTNIVRLLSRRLRATIDKLAVSNVSAGLHTVFRSAV